MKIPAGVRIGKDPQIDPGACVGVRPRRSKSQRKLTIGRKAVVRSGAVIYLGSTIGERLETGHHAVIREDNVIGDRFRIWNNSTVDYGCRIGNDVKIHCNCYVAQYTILEDDVFLAPGVTIANDLYPGDPISAEKMRGPHLEKGAQIGVNATLLPYVRIGAGAVVGSGAVVTRDVAAGTVVVGNPARLIGTVKDLKPIWRRRLGSQMPKGNFLKPPLLRSGRGDAVP